MREMYSGTESVESHLCTLQTEEPPQEAAHFGVGAALSVCWGRVLTANVREAAKAAAFITGGGVPRSREAVLEVLSEARGEACRQHPELVGDESRLEVEALEWALWSRRNRMDASGEQRMIERWVSRQEQRLRATNIEFRSQPAAEDGVSGAVEGKNGNKA